MKRYLFCVMALVCFGQSLKAQSFPCDFTIDCEDIVPDLKLDILIPPTIATGEQFCAEFNVMNLNYVISMQFDINYDPSVLEIDCSTGINTGNCLPSLLQNNFTCTNGTITMVYFNPNVEGICCNDGSSIFELCFTVVGSPLDPININVDNTSDFVEISYGLDINTDICIDTIFSCITTTPTSVACPNLDIIASYCDASSGQDTGTITFSICGGTAPYDYDITALGANFGTGTLNADGEEVTITGLAVEQYLITVTDATGGMTTQLIFIMDTDPLTFELDSVLPSCYDKQNGSIEVINLVGPGGTNPINYNFDWSNNQFGSNEIDGLAPGIYAVTVSDKSTGCSATDVISIELDTLILNWTVLDSASCLGAENGMIKLTAEGGKPFTTGPNTYAFQNDPSPTDCFIIDDAEGGDQLFLQVWDDPIGLCRDTVTIDVPYKDTQLEIQQVMTSQIECFGERAELFIYEISNATLIDVDLTDQFGVPITDPTILLNIIAGNTIRLENVPPGNYLLNVNVLAPQDLADCPDTQIELLLAEPQELIFTATGTNPDCAGNPGFIDFNTTGGTGLYDYTLNSNPIPINQLVDLGGGFFQIVDLVGGMYEFIVADQNGCADTANFDFPMAGSLDIAIDTIQDLSCAAGNIGVLRVEVTPACPSCTYDWVDINGTLLASGTFIQNLGQGCYTVIVNDPVQMCSAEATACLQASDAIEFNVLLTEPFCTGGTNGQIGIDITQGTTPFSFQWEDFPNINGSILAPVPAGTYCVTIGDDTGCEVDTCIQLIDPLPLTLDLIGTQDADCFAAETGIVSVDAINGFMGTTNFSYQVFDANGIEVGNAAGTGTVMITDLAPGDYSVIAIDGQCVSDAVPFTIGQPDQIQVDLDNVMISEPSCFGLCDGEITAAGMGGAGGYTFTWQATGLVSPTIDNLCGDQFHFVEILDSDGCIVRDSIFLVQPDSLEATLNTAVSTPIPCFNANTGTISISMSGGTGPFEYDWENNISDTNIATDLGVGIYNVTITDQNGCTALFTEELDSPPPIVADIPIPATPACFGETTCITVNGATGGTGSNYTFSVNNGPQMPFDSCFTVIADTYLISVFDGSGAACAFDTTIVIDQPDPVLVDLGDDMIEVMLGDSSAILQANITAVNAVTIDWSPMDQFECQDPLCQIVSIFPSEATTYGVTVTDSNGCSATDEVLVLIGEERPVYIPNVFSPNGDGFNERFGLFFGDGIQEVEYFGVFDRWGNLMFEAENFNVTDSPQFRWDGKFKGEDVQPGVYAYIAKVNFIDDFEQTYRGTVTIMR